MTERSDKVERKCDCAPHEFCEYCIPTGWRAAVTSRAERSGDVRSASLVPYTAAEQALQAGVDWDKCPVGTFTVVLGILRAYAVPRPAVEGWKLVPIEPTKAMIKAAEKRIDDFKESGYDTGGDGESNNTYEYFLSGVEDGIYKAMVEAAPDFIAPEARRIHDEAIVALARRCGWSEVQSRPLECFIEDAVKALENTPSPQRRKVE